MPARTARPTPHNTLDAPALPGLPTVLQGRRWWLLLCAWGVVVGSAFYVHSLSLRAQSMTVALEGARHMFQMVVLTRTWNASHGGVYVPITPQTPPNPYLEDPQRDVVTTSGLALTKINPAYMTRLIAAIANGQTGAVFRLTSLRPLRPENSADPWERLALATFEHGAREATTLEPSERGLQLRYMAPLKVQQSCMACHAKQGYQVGDVRGGISVSQPYAPMLQATQTHLKEDAWMYLLIFALVALGGWALLELLRQRWLDLIQKAEALSASQRQLLLAEKMASVGQLAAGMAHEINNPVGFVTSNLATLKDYTAQLLALATRSRAGLATEADFAQADFDFIQADVADLFQESEGGLARIKTLVGQLRAVASVDTQTSPWLDLNEMLTHTLALLRPQLGPHAEVVCEWAALPQVPGVAAHLSQVAGVLLDNAARALSAPGRITLRSGCEAQEVWFEVSDTGCGMPPEVVPHIFEPFFTTRAVGQGSGLGLSQAYELVRAHGGRIEVRHSQPGQGSTLRVTLPTHRPEPLETQA
ncbi:ATP-binding protein [Rhodoferax sp.]|uniref:ATP-binding protein n=1 Tax=Rhodoferax sp. TaxID=50421 RepID=UPI00262EECF0|nr:ATP-binding protein [Rhodoferax sp.]MDD4943481.1 DUF3365 domain-containing protein [Rhodoferax sp.]MDD5479210.1 DUF3365 domain-containing protein [Rhodoferax sp.]